MAITYVGADLVQELQQALPAALAGDEDAARRYARAWHQLVLQLVGSASRAPASAVEVLDRLSLTAPFDPLGPIHALMSVASTIIGDMDQRPAVRSSPVILPTSSAGTSGRSGSGGSCGPPSPGTRGPPCCS